MKRSPAQKGFTLIELLVVIAIIAVIIAFAVTNFLGARERARDVKRKSELTQLKGALRLYYSDFQKYPGSSAGNKIMGCGINGDIECPTGSCPGADFASGGAAGCTTVYMKKLPDEYSYTAVGTDGFLLKARLDNASDSEITKSQARCGYPVPTPGEYHQCAD